MDPLSITSTVLGIAAKCVTVARDLSTLRDKYTHASLSISAISSESAVVNAALCKLQSLFSQPQDEAFLRFQSRPELAAACDAALTGCTLLYSCLDDEVQSIRIQAPTRANADLSWSQKAKISWKDDTMKELLQQIRGQTSALNLQLRCFHFEHALETRHLLLNQGDAISQIKSNMSMLRSAYLTKQNMPESVLGNKRSIQAVFADNASVIGDTEFAFDDIVVNSRAYRQAMAAAVSYAKTHTSDLQDVLDESPQASILGPVGSAQSAHVLDPDSEIDSVRPPRQSPELDEPVGVGQPLQRDGLAPPIDSVRSPRLSPDLEIPAETVLASQQVEPAPPPNLDAQFLDAMPLFAPGTSDVQFRPGLSWKQLLEYQGPTRQDVLEEPRHIIEFREIWLEVLTSEQSYIRGLLFTKPIFADQILVRSPKVVQDPEQFVDEVYWASHGVWAPFDPVPFQNLLDCVSDLILEYCSNTIRAKRRAELEIQLNPRFREFLKSRKSIPFVFGPFREFLKSQESIHFIGRHDLFIHITAHTAFLRTHRRLLKKLKKRLPVWDEKSQQYAHLAGRQITRLLDQLQQLMTKCDTLEEQARDEVDLIDISIRIKAREYLNKDPADLSWLRSETASLSSSLQAFFQIKPLGGDSYWSWCEFIATGQRVFIADVWKWTNPSERATGRAPGLCALSVKMEIWGHILKYNPEDAPVQPRRRLFGLFATSAPRQAGDSVFVVLYGERTSTSDEETRTGEIVLAGKSSDLSRFVRSLPSILHPG